MNDAVVGRLDWDACETCTNYRPETGGCDPLYARGNEILQVDFELNEVLCREFNDGVKL